MSASQIETWRTCKRKWAWRKIDRIEGPANTAAEKGKIVHEVLESWLKHGVVIDPDATRTLPDGTVFKPGPIAAAGLKHLPMPGTCGTERRITVKTKLVKYQGFIDWDVQTGDIPVVGDHKTTSDFKWAKTEDDLRKDPQATIYAAALMNETGKSAVELRWVYYTTRGRAQSKKVSLIVLREDIEKNFDDLDATSVEILEAKKNVKTALHLEPNVRSCDMYGGCQFRVNCNLSTAERIKGMMAQETLAEKMEQRRKEPTMATLAEKMAARNAGKAKPSAGTNGATTAAAAGTGINPPEGRAPTTPADMAAAAAATTAAAAPPAVDAGKAKRGRPAGAAAAAVPEVGPVAQGGLRTAKEIWRGYAMAALSGGHAPLEAIEWANVMLDHDLNH